MNSVLKMRIVLIQGGSGGRAVANVRLFEVLFCSAVLMLFVLLFDAAFLLKMMKLSDKKKPAHVDGSAKPAPISAFFLH